MQHSIRIKPCRQRRAKRFLEAFCFAAAASLLFSVLVMAAMNSYREDQARALGRLSPSADKIITITEGGK